MKNVEFSNFGSNPHIRCSKCGENRHSSYACPQTQVSFEDVGEEEEELLEPTYDYYIDEEKASDIYHVQE